MAVYADGTRKRTLKTRTKEIIRCNVVNRVCIFNWLGSRTTMKTKIVNNSKYGGSNDDYERTIMYVTPARVNNPMFCIIAER